MLSLLQIEDGRGSENTIRETLKHYLPDLTFQIDCHEIDGERFITFVVRETLLAAFDPAWLEDEGKARKALGSFLRTYLRVLRSTADKLEARHSELLADGTVKKKKGETEKGHH
jgi:hypothetical protein